MTKKSEKTKRIVCDVEVTDPNGKIHVNHIDQPWTGSILLMEHDPPITYGKDDYVRIVVNGAIKDDE